MAKLHQVLAVVSGKKTDSEKGLSELYKKIQKPALFNGLSKVYQSNEENGDSLPAENTRVQLKATEVVQEFKSIIGDTLDVVATQDAANTSAKADIEVDGKVIVKDVPATYLLYLEKRLTDFHTFANHLPTLDPSEEWNYDSGNRVYKTPVLKKSRSKKVPKVIVKYEATKEHPAQTEMFNEDIIMGYWNETKMSGAMTVAEKSDLLTRVKKLTEAVKFAREKANQVEAPSVKVADSIFGYIFGA